MTRPEIFATLPVSVYRERGDKKMIQKLFRWMTEKDSRRKCGEIVFVVLTLYGAAKLLGGLWVNLIYLGVQIWDRFSPQMMAVSIGVIGGADGPTAIFVTVPPWVQYLLPAVCLGVGILGLWKLRRYKKQ